MSDQSLAAGSVAVSGARLADLLSSESEARRAFTELAESIAVLGRPVKSLVVTGPEAGVGRTTVCVGLGAAFAALGKRAAIVDCNLESPRLHHFFERPNFLGLTNALAGGGDPARFGFEAASGVTVIPTGPVEPAATNLVRSRRLVRMVDELCQEHAVVLLDAPVARTVLEFPNLWGQFDGTLLVIHAARTPKGVAREVTDNLLNARLDLLGVVLNGYA